MQRSPRITRLDEPDHVDDSGGSLGSRAIAFPVNALVVLLAVAAANGAVYFGGLETFVQVPSFFVPIRNIGLVLLLLVIGRALMPRRSARRAENLLLIAALLFGLGLATQFRLGHDAPRQLSQREIAQVADTVNYRTSATDPDSIEAEVAEAVEVRNSQLRRSFSRSRIDLRLARGLEEAYGRNDTTALFVEGREVAPMDAIWFRIMPLVGFALLLLILMRTGAMTWLTRQWRAVGLYGSLALCLVTFIYLGAVGGVRGSSLSPQELLKLTIPIAWAGLLVRYRGVLAGDALEKMTNRPVVLWLYVLALMALPLLVFVAVRDFGQFLTIGIAQVFLLAWFTRRPLYVILFGAGFAVATIVLLGDAITFTSPLFLVLAVIAIAVVLLGRLEKFSTGEGSLWPTASVVLTLSGLLAWLASLLPVVRDILSTPRARFMLWADLYGRNGDPSWWDNSRQVIESLFALDAGGLLGSGFAEGSPFLIPKAGSDFVFAAIVEESGFIGGLLLILLFLGLVVAGLRIATARGRTSFFGLLAAGYSLLLGLQAFVHIAGTMNIMPMTGITLPFVSSGNSSLIVSWLIVAILLAIAVRTRASEEEEFVVVRAG